MIAPARRVTKCTFWSSGETALGQVQPCKQGEDGSGFGTTSPTAKETLADHSLGHTKGTMKEAGSF